jgi:uncharacterized protein YbjT (DUF2867 family)
MIAIMGAAGHTGRSVCEKLLAEGQRIRAIGRHARKLEDLRRRGAEIAVGDAGDAGFLASALRGTDAVYAMVPPDLTAPDIRAHYARFGDSIGEAAHAAGIRRMVFLSSLGADVSSGTGPILGLHDLEGRFTQLGLDLLILRPGYFYDNFYSVLGLIRHQGINGGAIEPEVPVPMTATCDIGAAAGEALSSGAFCGTTVCELLGPRDYTMAEATRILGERIGRPDLGYVRFADSDFASALAQMGFSGGMAAAFLEMSRAFNAGIVRSLQGRNERTTMPTSFEDFSLELADAYRSMQG